MDLDKKQSNLIESIWGLFRMENGILPGADLETYATKSEQAPCDSLGATSSPIKSFWDPDFADNTPAEKLQLAESLMSKIDLFYKNIDSLVNEALS